MKATFSLHLFGLSILLCVGSCASLTPYDEVVQSLPKERIVEVDGQRIYVEEHGSGPTLLMLHGFASSTYSFRRIIPALAKTHRVIAIDLNGFGYTERPVAPEKYQSEAQIGMIQQLLDKLGVRRCDVVGHSYGGALAILFARQDPSRVRRLVLISPVSEFERTSLLPRSAIGRELAYRTTRMMLGNRAITRAGVRVAFYQDRIITREVSEEYRKRLLVEGFRDSFVGYNLAVKANEMIPLPLAEVSQPTLIIAGRHDQLISLKSCEKAAETMPNATLRVMEESGHSAAEEQPEEVVEMIEGFLQVHEPFNRVLPSA